MAKSEPPPEVHKNDSIGWLRASVLGANDGIISTSCLILGVAAANASPKNILITGVAGLAAGAMSMASGEFVSVSSQADIENSELAKEKLELASNSDFEHEELAQIYVGRGLAPALARQVAEQLMAYDALGSHARDELGITENRRAQPVQAAFASAGSFATGAALPLLVTYFSSAEQLAFSVSLASLLFLVALGMLAAAIGGAHVWRGALRVGFWGAFAMAITAGIGSLFGTA